MIRKILLALIVVLIIFLIVKWDLVSYVIAQARGQLSIINNTVSVNEVLQDPNFPDSLKSKIQIINEVRRFAIDSIGITDSDNYTTFYDQQGKTALWNLSASQPYSFEPKTWSFFFLGSFPYKGFFELERAKNERKQLDDLGFDTRIRPVGGWSTLGWFSDPILSNMLDRSEGRIADLIIHELTHGTLFVKNDIVFNENLASFIGERGAIQFLQSKYGKGSNEVESYIMENQDANTFTQQMLLSTSKLDSLYDSFTTEDDSAKKALKHVMIDQIISSLDTVHFHNERYRHVFENVRPNNAYFMSFLRYHSAEDSLNSILLNEYENNLKLFIKGMKDYHDD